MFGKVKRPTKHMKKLCESLGKEYSICVIDGEQVIYRDFGNGYDLEISGMNTISKNKKAILFLWKDKNVIVKTIREVKQKGIKEIAEGLKNYCKQMQVNKPH